METDAPDIPPQWLYVDAAARAAGQTPAPNTPAELPRIGAEVATLRGALPGEWAAQSSANALAALPRLGALLDVAWRNRRECAPQPLHNEKEQFAMFKHILVPVDGSPTSLSAVGTAAAVAAAFGSDVTAIYVIDPYPFTGVGADFAYGQDQYLKAAHAEADGALGAVTKQLDGSGTVVNTRIVESHTPWRGILDAAEEAKADLIVMGSHGRRGLEKLVLGSVAQRVLTNAKVPVLVVQGAEKMD